MDEELNSLAEEHEPRISIVEIFIVGGLLALVDTIQVVLAFFLLDDFWILDILVSVVFFYLKLKGVPAIRQLIAWIGELVPYVGALPLNTIGFLATVYLDRHPKVAVKVATAMAVAGKVKGGGKTGEQGGAAQSATKEGGDKSPEKNSEGDKKNEQGRGSKAIAYARQKAGEFLEEAREGGLGNDDSFEEEQATVYGMPADPLSDLEIEREFSTVRPFPQPTQPEEGDERVILKGNNVDLRNQRKAA